MIGINIHGVKIIKAEAREFAGSHWLKLIFDDGNEIAVFFKHADNALAYASAINTCNDREAAEAAVLTGVDGGDVG